MWTLALVAITAAVLGVAGGVMWGVGSRHACRSCGATLMQMCLPGFGCRKADWGSAHENPDAIAIADQQIADGAGIRARGRS